MKIEELKEYLGIVVDMEQSIFLQKNLLSSIEVEIEQLKVPRRIDDPIEPTKPVKPNKPVEPTQPITASGVVITAISSLIMAFVSWFISTLVIMFILYYVIKDLSFDWLILLGFVPPIVIIISSIVYFIEENRGYKANKYAVKKIHEECEKQYQEQVEQYRVQMDSYQLTLNSNQHKRQEDQARRQLKSIFLQKQKEQVEKSLAASEKHLQAIYEKGIIFPKYRNLVMVCSLYEYICAGRCTELDGHEGAYNILEIEIRLDRIIVQLDEVVKKLEQIRLNQYTLYSAMQEANRRLSQICSSIGGMSTKLDDFYNSSIQLNEQVAGLNAQNAELNAHIAELQKTSALTAYHTERTQKELAYMNRMDYLLGRNDDVFFNHPPV